MNCRKMNKPKERLSKTEEASREKIVEKYISELSIEERSEISETEEQNVNDYDTDTFSNDDVRSETPTNYNERDHIFHLNFFNDYPTQPKKYKNGTRKSYTFTNDRMREIERANHILLKKILAQGPNSNENRRKVQSANEMKRQSSAEINRRKQQRQIDLDNQVLRRKIEQAGRRKSGAGL